SGEGIEAGWVSCALRIFAGLVNWRLPRPDDEEIRAEVRSGTVALGRVVPPASDPEQSEAAE
ncbi:hypothetical protein V5F44_20530, partial [Xanthobacter sp. V2C-8]|uniref:hypothetical protein n=1 Tax=Xanthobacter albus TaxID=3119929 RepID=UPI00372A886C